MSNTKAPATGNEMSDVTDRFESNFATLPYTGLNVEFQKAFLKAQPNIEAAIKDSKNPHFKSNYADINSVIEACKEHLNAVGITIMQPMGGDADGRMWVKTLLTHANSGQYVESKMYIPKTDNVQAVGSAITYGRRYTLQALCLLTAEDDDGESTMDRAPAPAARPPYQKPGAPYKPGGR